MARGIKCGRCWILVERCLCAKVTPLRTVTRPWRFLIYMSREDYLNGGNSAKLLSVAAPTRSQIFVHGRRADEQRLREAVAEGGEGNAVLLFPDEGAFDAKDWLRGWLTREEERRASGGGGGGSGDSGSSGGAGAGDGDGDGEGGGGGGSGGSGRNRAADAEAEQGTELTVVVVDGTWNKARKLAKYFGEKIAPRERVPHLQLSPTALSVFKRKQSRPDRICTLEYVMSR